MSKKESSIANMQEVKIDVITQKPRRNKDKGMPNDGTSRGVSTVARNSDFVYVNSAYVGSLNSVNETRINPPTGVYREQYWACSRWPYGTRILAISVGLLLGTVIGLAVSMAIKSATGNANDNVIAGFFRYSPD